MLAACIVLQILRAMRRDLLRRDERATSERTESDNTPCHRLTLPSSFTATVHCLMKKLHTLPSVKRLKHLIEFDLTFEKFLKIILSGIKKTI